MNNIIIDEITKFNEWLEKEPRTVIEIKTYVGNLMQLCWEESCYYKAQKIKEELEKLKEKYANR